MSSLKLLVPGVLAALCVCVSQTAAAQPAPRLAVSNESQTIQTPLLAPAGISYVPTGAATSGLTVYTDGFLFCANVSSQAYVQKPVTLSIAHEDQTMQPAHSWLFGNVNDIQTFSYSGGALNVIASQDPRTLTCLSTSDQGAVASALSDGIFDNGNESATDTNYRNLVNWKPLRGFDWTDPDAWTAAPQDPCNVQSGETPRVVEDVACAAVTGVQSTAQSGAVRAATIWTATDGSSFTYLFRFDARFGAQVPGVVPSAALPDALDEVTDVNVAKITIRDAFDKTFLDGSAGAGTYCLLTQVPSTLNSAVCANSSTVATLNGVLDTSFFVGVPPGNSESRFFYVAVTRPVIGGHSTLSTPVVGVSAMIDPVVAQEGGDKFTGDNVVFGFMPISTGFPWMSGQ